jgi:hypothetical protein
MSNLTSLLRLVVEAKNNSKKAFGSLSKSLVKNMKDFEKAKAASAGFAVGLAGVAAAVGAVGVKSIMAASDLNELNSKANEVFGAEGKKQVDEWAKTTSREVGRARSSLLGYATDMQAVVQPMGLANEEAQNMSQDFAKLAVDMASFHNASDVEAFNALRSAITGETEPMKRFGVVMTEANLAAFALSQGITKNIKDMTQGEKTQLRYNFIMEQTKVAQGDAARTADGMANQYRRFQENVKEVFETLGEPMLEITSGLMAQLNEIVQEFVQDTLPEWIETGKNIIKFFQENEVALYALVGAIVGALIPSIYGAAVAFGSLMLSLAPFIIGGAVIAGIIAGVMWIWENWDYLKQKAVEIWGKIKQFIYDAALFMTEKILNMNKAIGNGIMSAFKWIADSIKSIKDKLISWARWLIATAYEWGMNMINMLGDGMKAVAMYPINKAQEIADGIADYIGWSSPTKKGAGADSDKWASNLMNMLGDGIAENTPNVVQKVQELAEGMKEAMKSKNSDMMNIQLEFVDSVKKTKEELQKLTEEYQDNVSDIQKSIADVRNEILSVEKEQISVAKQRDASLAKEIATQKELIATLEEKFKKESEKDSSDSAKEIEAELAKQKNALARFADEEKRLQDEINQIEEFNRLTRFEQKALEIQKKNEQKQQELQQEKIELEEKIQKFKDELTRRAEEHAQHLAVIEEQRARDMLLYKAALDTREKEFSRHVERLRAIAISAKSDGVNVGAIGGNSFSGGGGSSGGGSQTIIVNQNFDNINLSGSADLQRFKEEIVEDARQKVVREISLANQSVPR